MKALFFFPLALIAVSSADVPQKAALTRYIQLWSESPFTRKPPPEQIVETTPLDDYALGGVSPVDGGYFVILLNRKKPDEKVIIQPGQTSDFRVLEVRPGDTGPLSTSVLVGAGSKSKLLSFDEKLLTLKTAPTGGKPPIAGQTGTPAGQPPGQPQPIAPPQQQAGGRPNPNGQSGTQGSGARPPRPRVIPPTR
jgi:hypothetical protein